MRNNTDPRAGSDRSILRLDHVFEALAHPRRRYLVYTVLEDDQWTLEELGSKIAQLENEGAETSSEAVTNVTISLYHNHIPKLVEDEIVEFHEPTRTIEPGPNAEQVLAVLEHAGGSSDVSLEAHARGDFSAGLG